MIVTRNFRKLLPLTLLGGTAKMLANRKTRRHNRGLYRPELNVNDACGIGGATYEDSGRTPSFEILEAGLALLTGMEHRGGSTPYTGHKKKNIEKDGDGAGCSTDVPFELFRDLTTMAGWNTQRTGDLGVGMFFLPPLLQSRAKLVIEKAFTHCFGAKARFMWREVPIVRSACGERSAKLMPDIWQLLIERPSDVSAREFEILLFAFRLKIKRMVDESASNEAENRNHWKHYYCCSCSAERMLYKGMLTGEQLSRFFIDLKSPLFKVRRILVHERFATNTASRWGLAQPFEFLCHNGELNTLRRLQAYMRELAAAYGPQLEQRLRDRFGVDFTGVFSSLIDESLSDSGQFNDAFGAFIILGKYLSQDTFNGPEYLLTMIQSAWQSDQTLTVEERAMWEYMSMLMPTSDGPAAMFFSTGRWIGARLDRAGYRPLRWQTTKDGLVVFASEANILQTPGYAVTKKAQLGPGEMLVIDTETGKVYDDKAFRQRCLSKYDFLTFTNDVSLCDKPQGFTSEVERVEEVLPMLTNVWPTVVKAAAAGWSGEELELFVLPACTGKDPAGSMGDDAQLACFRDPRKHPTPLSYFLYELFAQVTNPAWDSVKERVIGSLRTYLGGRRSPFDFVGEVPRTLVLETPILSETRLDWVIKSSKVCKLRITMALKADRKECLDRLCEDAKKAIQKEGAQVLVLTDRDLGPQRKMIPAVQAVSYLNRYLAKNGLATKVRLVVETAEVRTPHDLAALLAYGASAVHPWAAFELIRNVHYYTPSSLGGGDLLDILNKYISALETGLLKIMAKYGVADVESYIGSRNMESLGIDGGYAAQYLGEREDDSPIGGLNEKDFDVIYDTFHANAFAMLEGVECVADLKLPNYGRFQMRRDGIARGFDYELVDALQRARNSRKWEDWQEFRRLANERPYPIVPKDFFEPRPTSRWTKLRRSFGTLSSVCSINELMDRMRTSPMSFGSISPEAHEDLALAAYLRGFRTNCGEGGEWPARMQTILRSRGKQVASGRFGVNAPYLVNADQIEIKICQGAKPGEGGALSYAKVTPIIGATRGTPAHVSLTSPPPHHDIYSIEDLKQLIYDLKAINPDAQIIVKLVAARGIGAVAIGVTKAGADIIQIAGFNGGTGNAPLNSIHFAGYPWEIGLAEAHQALLQAGIRDEVLLGVDGGFLTGRDVVIAACLGAQMFGLGTAALISAGCVINKMCHTNNCPVGVATNRADLRKNYTGRAEFVFNYFTFIGEEIQRYLQQLGVSNLDQIVGRTDMLQITDRFECRVDLSKLLYRPVPNWRAKRLVNVLEHRNQLNPVRTRLGGQICERVTKVLASETLTDAGLEPLTFDISTCNLAVGARVSGQIAKIRGSQALAEDAVVINFLVLLDSLWVLGSTG